MTIAKDDLTLCPFEASHLEGAVALSRQASWPHRREDWALVLKISRGVVALSEGRVVGTAFCTPFGEKLAAMNMIIVEAGMRGRGLGRRLMQETMALAGDRTLRLVATEEGRPLYEKLGFAATGTVVQHQGMPTGAVPPAPGAQWAMPRDREAIAELDRAAFGADRGNLLSCLLEEGRAAVLREEGRVSGFALCRPFGRGFVIGPAVARNPEEARSLVAAQINVHRGLFLRVDTGTHTGLAPWLSGIGLTETGRGTVMYRGAPPRLSTAVPSTFALASQALG
ncbi:MAG TPA: GNAT family N-acetyltransferase [Rhizobiaceae bacterium]|nr:GNAT family N-acetyltransferase [Rhizobiaceae bacterium]